MKSVEDFFKQQGKTTAEIIKIEENTKETPTTQTTKTNWEDDSNSKPNAYQELENYDKNKTKVLKYIMYKKRTEQEIRRKFSSCIDANLLEDIIEELTQKGYINDENYITRAVNEFLAIHTLSRKEIKNKLYAKGLSSRIVDEYMSNHREEMLEYEIKCAKKIILKKQLQMEKAQIEAFLYKKGYTAESVRIAYEELENT